MHRQEGGVLRPHRNRRGPEQYAGVGRQHEARRGRRDVGGVPHDARHDVAAAPIVDEIRKRRRGTGVRECDQRPGADRHRALDLEDSQHVEKTFRPSQVRDQQRRRDDRACGGYPARVTHETFVATQPMRDGGDDGRRSGCPTDKKIRRHLPRPHGTLQRRPTVVVHRVVAHRRPTDPKAASTPATIRPAATAADPHARRR